MVWLASATWLLGDVEYARRLTEEAVRDGHASVDVATITHAYLFRAVLEVLRDHPNAALRAAEELLSFAREHNAVLYAAGGSRPAPTPCAVRF